MKVVVAGIASVFLVFVGIQIYSFSERGRATKEAYRELARRVEEARDDYQSLQTELDYYLRPENLEKELRARFNYRRPEEKIIIIVPPRSSSTTSTVP